MKLIKDIQDKQIISNAKQKCYENVTFSKGFVNFMESLVNHSLINEDYKRLPLCDRIRWDDKLTNDGIIFETTQNPLLTGKAQFAGNITIIGNKSSLEMVDQLMKINEVQYSGQTKPQDIEIKVEYHNTLNPKLWEDKDTLQNDVMESLMSIAQAFFDFLEMPDLDVEDVCITGSSANYNWTDVSDIDLHLLVNVSEAEDTYGSIVGQYFDAQRKVWNEMHTIVIHDIPVEVYVQDTAEEHISTGVYSIQNEDWVREPTKEQPSLDNIAVKTKSAHLMDEIDDLVEGEDPVKIDAMMEKLKKMRQAGLSEAGEFSTENYVYKTLRNEGYIDKLADTRTSAVDTELSVEDEENDPWSDLGYIRAHLKQDKEVPKIPQKKTKIILNVPYSQRELAKKRGAKFNPATRKWFMEITNSEISQIPTNWR